MKKTIFNFLLLLSFLGITKAQESVTNETEVLVLISTDLGNIKVKLYNETPKHRDNFVKLVKDGTYDGSIFHRVIPQFMVQGGGGFDGTQDLGKPIAAEIIPAFIHKRGALAAARMGDNVNPERNSSGSQFYIVQGRPFSASDIEKISKSTRFAYTPEQVEEYVKSGGAPHLDGAYTIFGEVVDGLDVVDKIAALERDKVDRPLKDIKMKMRIVKK